MLVVVFASAFNGSANVKTIKKTSKKQTDFFTIFSLLKKCCLQLSLF